MFKEFEAIAVNRISDKRIHIFMSKILDVERVDVYSIKAVVDGLIYASLRGIDSHGVRLFPHYVDSVIKGTKNGNPKFKISKPNPSKIIVDADGGFGLAAGHYAISNAMKISNDVGMCLAVVKNSTHPAALSSIIVEAVSKGFIVFGFANADSLMSTHGGKNAFFGTNPFTFGVPANDCPYLMVDMAMTHFTWNRLKIYRELDMELPKNVAVDSDGNETTNPHLAKSLIPTGNHKGFALAAMVEVMTGVLAGGLISPEIAPMYDSSLNEPRGLSQSYLIIDPGQNDRFESIRNGIDHLTKSLQSSEINNNVGLPGFLEFKIEIERSKIGIPIDSTTLEKFDHLSNKYGIKL